MRYAYLVLCTLLIGSIAFGQGALGTITGTITDPSGAVVPNAAISIRNPANGLAYQTATTATGNYTVPQLPVGLYELTVKVPGFKDYTRAGLDLAAAQIMRIDIPLQLGSQGESVTVTAEASLLKTESGDVTHNVTVGQLNTLPVLSIGGGGSTNTNGFRDPLGVALMIPGVQYAANSSMVVNGVPNGTTQIRIEGQTSGQTGSLRSFTGMGQPSVEAVQEVAVQTSNFAAEYGEVGGAIFNVTMKSGTNQYHGSAYDYAVNEALNAHQPYTGLRSPAKRHDYGGTFGGPIKIPKLYDGTNKSFFFLGFEQFREDIRISTSVVTVPIDAYRVGNFTQVIVGSGNLPIQVGGKNYIDPLGRTGFLAGTIFDPNSQQTVLCDTVAVPGANCANGSQIQVRDPFMGNQIPTKYFDPVSLNILKLVPEPTGPNFLSGQTGGNYQNPWLSSRRSRIPSIKLDHSLTASNRVSFYYQGTDTGVQYTTPNGLAEGLPEPITVAIGSYAGTATYRLSDDYSVSPTMLLHLGIGWFHNNFDTSAGTLNYNAATEIGLRGATVNRTFPQIQAGGNQGSGTGGMNNLGPNNQSSAGSERRPSAVANFTWVKNNHTYKIGGEWRGERYPAVSYTNTSGTYSFTSNSTQQTALQAVPTSQGGVGGFPFASFLMGQVTGYSLSLPTAVSTGKQEWGLFIQDTWKLTRKLTMDYGLRWDWGGYARESGGRNANFSATVPNSAAGGHPGAQIFEANCNCNFAGSYPYAIGPRLGLAYQINRKTVLRGGFGVVYTATGTVAGVASNTASGGTPGNGQFLGLLKDGMPSSVQPQWPVFDPAVGQAPGSVVAGPAFLDPNAGRPARQYQWSVGLQREINKDLVVDAAYVANRGVWWPAAALGAFNVTSVANLTNYGFQVGNAADATLLTRTISALTAPQKSTLNARGVTLPYSNYPTNLTVRASLLPFPQYSSSFAPTLAPLGNTWYDSLQVNVTKRYSHGLTVSGNYTWSKNLDLMNSVDIFNRQLGKDLSVNDLPQQFRLTAEYQTPNLRKSGLGVLSNPVLAYVLGDWGIGWYLQYQSAAILARPASVSSGGNPISQWLGRGPGSAQLKTDPATGLPMSPWAVNWTDYNGVVHPEPIDINCGCFDPTKTLVLNPNAWQSIPDGQWAAQTSAIRDYRGFRHPAENFNLSRNFRFREGKIQLNLRAEFQNVFNRVILPNPTTSGFTAQPTTQSTGANAGLYNGGFGTVVPLSGTSGSRTGTLIGRLTF